MAAQQKGHKWFAAYWDRMTRMESRGLQELRDRTVSGLAGRVLEIGAGNGANFHRYPATVTQLVATEPDPYMLERARKRAAEINRPIELHQAPAEDLPLEDASFDAAVSILVLCSASDLAQALAEVKRVPSRRTATLHRARPLCRCRRRRLSRTSCDTRLAMARRRAQPQPPHRRRHRDAGSISNPAPFQTGAADSSSALLARASSARQSSPKARICVLPGG
jgi:SAM-dependent methyltransferase